jgi:DNA-binding transcriptional MocR family regulator
LFQHNPVPDAAAGVAERIHGSRAGEISASVEALIGAGELGPGDQLPPVRLLAERLEVSPTTVASAYRLLQLRGLITSSGRRGTRVADRPRVQARAQLVIPPNARVLALGNPDPDLLPDLGPVLARLGGSRRLYGEPANRPELLELAARAFRADGISPDFIAVVAGGLDGVERVLAAHLRAGDRVIVEDPGYPAILDLLGALGLRPERVRVDDRGLEPTAVERALDSGVQAAILTPRAQNPFGSALDGPRAHELSRIFDDHPDVLVVEDDHAGPVAGAAAHSLASRRHDRWALIRSVSKSLGPDLRLAVMAGDALTVARVEARQQIGAGWVSHILQRTVVELWTDPATLALMERAAGEYERRRTGLVRALASHGLGAHARSGLNVWIPVDDEAAAAARLLEGGWVVQPGQAYRLHSPPAIRISIGGMRESEAEAIAAALAGAAEPVARTRPA